MRAPLCIDLFCGLGGWTEGFLAEGYRVVGFDIERHRVQLPRERAKELANWGTYPAQLVLQNVLTIHGSQFRDATCIVASPPCQNYSYLAMPWSRSPDFVRPSGDGWEILNSTAAKEMRERWEREGPDNRLFDACFRIQREAIEATRRPCYLCRGGLIHSWPPCEQCGGETTVTRYIPLVVENVRGAIPWVGRSAWNYGSFHLWGDVPALMPINLKRGGKNKSGSWFNIGSPGQTETNRNPVHELVGQKVPGFRFDGSGRSFQSASVKMMRPNEKGIADDSKRMDGGYDPERGADSVPGSGSDEGGMREPGSVFPGMGTKGRSGGGWFGDARGNVDRRQDPRDVRKRPDGSWATPDGTVIVGTKQPGGNGDWFSKEARDAGSSAKYGSRSSARKQASAQIAKIPFELARHIASVFKPRTSHLPGSMTPKLIDPAAGAPPTP